MAQLQANNIVTTKKKISFWQRLKKDFRINKYVYIMAIPMIVFFILFSYVPMYGVTIAFKNFSPKLGIINSPWIGFKHFKSFFNSIYFARTLKNTVLLSFYSLLWGFPAAIILALLLNEIRREKFKG